MFKTVIRTVDEYTYMGCILLRHLRLFKDKELFIPSNYNLDKVKRSYEYAYIYIHSLPMIEIQILLICMRKTKRLLSVLSYAFNIICT